MSVAKALPILKEQDFLITFWNFTIRGFLSNSDVLVLLVFAFALYGFMCNSDWMDASKFEMVNALMWVRHGGLSC